jgi:hypothetical protein
MEKILDYSVQHDEQFNTVQVFDEGCIFCEIECLVDSPYSIEEEIQNWLDDNGYSDNEFTFNRIELEDEMEHINFDNED